MPRYARIRIICLAVLVSVLLAATAGPASAHRMHLKELITESSVLRTTVWTMGVEIMRLLLALDEPGSIARLREAHGRSGELLAKLRPGVDELPDRGDGNSDVLAVELALASRHWSALDDTLRPVLESGTVTDAQSRELIDRYRELGESIDQIHMHFHNAADHYTVVTVIGMAIMATERQRALGQRITGDFLAVTLGSDDEDRDSLGQSVTQFDDLLRSLQHGDAERGLIPPPTTQLRQELAEVEQIWLQMLPQLTAAASGDAMTPATVETVAALGSDLHSGLGAVKRLFSGLVPGGG